MKYVRATTSFLRRHRFAVILCVGAIVVTTGFLVTLSINERQQQRAAAEDRKRSTDQLQSYVQAQRKAQSKISATPTPPPNPANESSEPSVLPSCRVANTHSNPDAIDIIVNKKNCIQPAAYVPTDMEIVHGATISAKAIPQFSAMYTAAQAAGLPFTVSSSYRSYDQQAITYSHWVSVNGQVGADTVSARAGYSEHQTGLTIDVATEGCWLECFTTTPQRAWLQQYAADYGFIERYPVGATAITGYSPESWHYRYVGASVAQDMKKRGIATLEQYWGVAGGDYVN